jgi:hypothetical protein
LIGLEDVDWQNPNVHNLVDDLQMVLDKDQAGTTIVRTQTTRISEKEGKISNFPQLALCFFQFLKPSRPEKIKSILDVEIYCLKQSKL